MLYTTQAELDRKNVKRAVTKALLVDPSTQPATTTPGQGTTKWSIALAGGISLGTIVFVLSQSIVLGVLASIGIGFVASRNPLEEDDTAGAVARTVRLNISKSEFAYLVQASLSVGNGNESTAAC